ncbi:hypothetical protein F959_02951 [Acinetobacter venetianus RAG-1 = CIP 110063]|uniref:DUF6160 domain-containing protein n=1 Tax=Acinetobacter venetianus (strain ATCC 31012 / DSM 23050 / BCRC 14357 / CCUG 45561 / CIP 110063 / KCTC 2702 / LMG 19082 / RAG-1) TaxID=1191460 RepID=N8YHZ1_ACIVR|nr:DUF6160 family protein [Acinetobacter venetianus]ENV36417.1 hypothetical protein F959_02951 [Acinetobacter venetianus RAG-1 = CIP 110063]
MKMFTKLALVSSMAISANAMAMQAMDDAALSAATGQDGINIGIGVSRLDIEKVLIHDNDGLSSTGTAVGGTDTAGAIVIQANGTGATATKGIVIGANTAALLPSHNLMDLAIDTDAGAGGGNTAFLNIAAQVSGLDIAIGEIGVSASNATGTGPGIRRGNDASNYNAILSGLTLKTGVTSANIQLGAAPQGAMIVLNTTMTGGLEITDLGILDSSTIGQTTLSGATSTLAGEIHLDSIKVADASGANLTVNAQVGVVGESVAGANDGYLKITAGGTPTDVYISGVRLGSSTAASIGDVEVQGMQAYHGLTPTAGAVITISGH